MYEDFELEINFEFIQKCVALRNRELDNFEDFIQGWRIFSFD